MDICYGGLMQWSRGVCRHAPSSSQELRSVARKVLNVRMIPAAVRLESLAARLEARRLEKARERAARSTAANRGRGIGFSGFSKGMDLIPLVSALYFWMLTKRVDAKRKSKASSDASGPPCQRSLLHGCFRTWTVVRTARTKESPHPS